MVRSLALFVNALHQDDQQFVALNQNLADVTGRLASSDGALSNAIQQFDSLLTTVRPFLNKNREVLTHDVNNLATATNTLLQPEPLNGLETALHVLPTAAANINQIYHPSHGSVVAIPAITNFANPMQFICSSIQAGSRLGYQESAELCAQYLAPVLDAIKFNYLPFGAEPVQHRRDPAEASRVLRTAAAPAQRVQGHDRPRDLGAGYTDVASQHPAGLDRGPGDAGAAGRADHGGPDDSRVAVRTDGRPQHRAGSIQPADPAGTAERLRREPDPAAHRAAGSGADPAAGAGAGGDPGSGRSDAGTSEARRHPTPAVRRCPLTSGVASDACVTQADPPPGLAGAGAAAGRPGAEFLRLARHFQRRDSGRPGQRAGSYTVYVQVPDTLAINGNSKVMVADVFVGSIRPSS